MEKSQPLRIVKPLCRSEGLLSLVGWGSTPPFLSATGRKGGEEPHPTKGSGLLLNGNDLPYSENHFHRQLIQPFVRQGGLGELDAV